MATHSLTILRAAAVLDLLGETAEDLGAREVARRLRLSRSTAHRLLASLEHVGLAEQIGAAGKYRLGSKAASWAASSSWQARLRDKALPYMVRLRHAVEETVGLSARVPSGRTYLAQVESSHDIRWTVEIGRPYPLYAGAPGKILLAFLPDLEIERILNAVSLQRFTARTPVTPARIWADLRKVRRQGAATALGEIVDGSATIAAPVRDGSGAVVAALSISGPAFRFTGARRRAALPVLRTAAEELSKALGHGVGPRPGEARPQPVGT